MSDDSAMEEGRLEEIAARCEAATKGPWAACGETPVELGPPLDKLVTRRAHEHGVCQCRGVSSHVADQPICTVTDGKWGDTYPAIRPKESGITQDYEAYIKMIEYGDVPPEISAANAKFIAHARTDVPDLLAELRRLRAENDALKQQLQALREQDHMCRELVQEIADSKICWSDWAGDYIQWTEDITRKARKALGLKDE